jgi:hypothetical protein
MSIMDQAREAFDGCFKVVKGAGQAGLTTGLLHDQRSHKGRNGFLAMTVLVRQQVRNEFA